MKKVWFLGFFMVVFLWAEQVEDKLGVGIGAGFFKPFAYDEIMNMGYTYSGDVRFGLTDEIEVGLAFSYSYNHLGPNVRTGYFIPLRREGSTISGYESEFPYFHLLTMPPGKPADSRGQPWDEKQKLITTTDRSPNDQLAKIRFTYMPIEMFIKFRSLSKTIFNPYILSGIGYYMWGGKDEETGKALEALYFEDYYDTTKGRNWRPFKGSHAALLLGFGIEVFPIENVGVDLGFRGRYIFVDDFTKQVRDTLTGDAQIGARLNFYYGGVKDSDKDGVVDKLDKCPDTPFGATVDEFGCPMDGDNDGVPDGLDMCPNTPIGAIVDATGCPSDEDGDGVYDGIDKCPGTPLRAKVDSKGCPLDSDGDGVFDFEDACPNTPKGAIVDANGCPFDGDMDGVPDGIDRCPNTPPGMPVNEWGCEKAKADSDGDGVPDERDRCPNTPAGADVDEFGCTKDTDGDGIPDYKDACPGTPRGAVVDQNGCPLDGDGDGVADGIDKCPTTPLGAIVDERGCEKDTDNDGVPDGIDQCPRTPPNVEVDPKGCSKDSDNDGVPDGTDKCPRTPQGIEVDSTGCPKAPKLKKGQSVTIRIQFASCSWEIEPGEAIKLQDALNMLRGFPEMKVTVEGYTDNKKPTPDCVAKGIRDNVELSFRRAESVRQWLIDKGIDGARIEVKGYGEERPVATNDTEEGRRQNRRIEIRCTENCPGE